MTKTLRWGCRSAVTVGLVALAAACSGDDNRMTDSDDSATSGIGTDTFTTGSTGGSETATDGTVGTDTMATATDSGGSTTTGPEQLNCKFIDFVFVVDNSASMADEQAQLVQSVPGFVDAMKTALPTVQNFRVGVVDSDTYPGLGTVDDPLNGCPDGTDCSGCDYQLGAFLDKPNAAADPNDSCNFSTGTSYMDGDSPAFQDEFTCAAVVGTKGNPVEQQIGALSESLSPDMNGAGGCNDGFVRDNALLVFLVITDEEDDLSFPPEPQGGSLGDPGRWYDAVVAAKNGKPTNAVALSLIGGSPKFASCPDLMGSDGAEETPRIQEFVEKFPINFVGNVCDDGYDTFFNEALEKVAEGCMKFIP